MTQKDPCFSGKKIKIFPTGLDISIRINKTKPHFILNLVRYVKSFSFFKRLLNSGVKTSIQKDWGGAQ